MAGQTNQNRHPVSVFLSWFNGLPVMQQQYLAQMFFLCTTDNAADFALSPDEALVRFKNYVVKQDFVMRIICRLVMIRAVFDFILANRQQLSGMHKKTTDPAVAQASGRKLLELSTKQWEHVTRSWQHLRGTYLTDKIFQLWIQSAGDR